ncbi:MAG: HAD-IA family hydrolase [bacterium]|nr:HAD-IA family hydrolase [bacterium]MDT8395058.1 HAD-IA family hydrolase [bacterium]
MTQPRSVLFDLDNTVYAYSPCHQAGLNAAWSASVDMVGSWADKAAFLDGYDRARQRVKEQIRGAAASHSRLLYFKAMFEAVLGRTDTGCSRELEEIYWSGYFDQMKPDSGCEDVLCRVRSAGIRSAWVSNFTTERQLLKLEHLGLSGAVDLLVTSEEAGADKPDPAVLLLAMERLGMGPVDTWIVGDSLTDDVGSGKKTGVFTVWFDRYGEGCGKGGHSDPDAVVNSWAELGRLLGV